MAFSFALETRDFSIGGEHRRMVTLPADRMAAIDDEWQIPIHPDFGDESR